MGRRIQIERPVVRAARIILERGRTYRVGPYGFSLRVHTKRTVEADLLASQFCGGYYRMYPKKPRYRYYVWAVTRIEHLDYIWKVISEVREPDEELSPDLINLYEYLRARGYG